jgi:hypothetical protein
MRNESHRRRKKTSKWSDIDLNRKYEKAFIGCLTVHEKSDFGTNCKKMIFFFVSTTNTEKHFFQSVQVNNWSCTLKT